jgi:hypothetical protein
MVPYCNIKIYNVSGKLLSELSETNGRSQYNWNCKDDNGDDLLTGVYLWVLTSHSNMVLRGKLGVIR